KSSAVSQNNFAGFCGDTMPDSILLTRCRTVNPGKAIASARMAETERSSTCCSYPSMDCISPIWPGTAAGGYLADGFTPDPVLRHALNFVDQSGTTRENLRPDV